jgi:ornithine carbamoyltransferase
VTQPGDGPGAGGEVALLGSADEDRFRQRWGDAQARFVDDPQEAVRSADVLVAELMQSLAQGFSEHKERLEAQWQRGGDPDTEELRQALQRYRSFFNRLLST